MSTVEYDRLIRIRILFEKQAAIVFEIYGVEGEDYRTHLKPAFADVDKAVKELGDLINIRIAVGNMFPIGGSPPLLPKEREIAISFLQESVGFGICQDSSPTEIVANIRAIHVTHMDPPLQCTLFGLLDNTDAYRDLIEAKDFEGKPIFVSKGTTDVPSLSRLFGALVVHNNNDLI